VGCNVGPVADVVGVDHLHYGAQLLGWLSKGNIVTASNNLIYKLWVYWKKSYQAFSTMNGFNLNKKNEQSNKPKLNVF
jgi:hypothetical protein